MSAVLVVDDDPVSRIVLKQMLAKAGMTVAESASVDEAIARLNTQHFDLVVCDYLMPERNGLDLLEVLADTDDRPHFVLLTGTVDRADLGDSRVDGVSAYLTKPVSTKQLTAAVSGLLGVAH